MKRVEASPNPDYPLTTDEKKTIAARYNCCKGCKWHPDVCEYCNTNKIVTDGERDES